MLAVDTKLLEILEVARADLVGAVTINSGWRCPAYNTKIGGAKKSQHMTGLASDINVKGKTPKEVYDYLDNKYPDKYGIGLYRNFVHIDVREGKARW